MMNFEIYNSKDKIKQYCNCCYIAAIRIEIIRCLILYSRYKLTPEFSSCYDGWQSKLLENMVNLLKILTLSVWSNMVTN